MLSIALPEDQLRPFLRRSRKQSGTIELPPLGQHLAETLSISARLVPSYQGALLLDTPSKRGTESTALTYVAAFGSHYQRLLGTEVRSDQGIMHDVYNLGKSFRSSSESVSNSQMIRYTQDRDHDVRSLVAVPVLLERHVCGVLELANRKGRKTFSERDFELVKLVGGYISRSILNAVDIIKQNELALYDPLTGVRNVRGLHDYLDREVDQASSEGNELSVLFVDLDHLKVVNDRFGHRAGSEAIRKVAKALVNQTAQVADVFRFGGDEFVVICRGLDESAATKLTQQVLEEVRKQDHGSFQTTLTVSVGIASLKLVLAHNSESRLSNAQQLLALADRALYRAKRQGRNRYVVATQLDVQEKAQAALR